MTNQGSPGQRLLDLLVYAPAGLVLTAVEELPQLADKGRRRIEGQMTTARVVGQFTVQFVEHQVRDRIGSRSPASSGPTDTVRTDTVRPNAPSGPPAAGTGPLPTGGTRSDVGSTRAPRSAVSQAPVAPARSISVPSPAPASDADGANLAIPGYDSLSASQVVQRLPGLDAADLRQVLAHESAHRHRRTILNRVGQLLEGTVSPADG